MIFIWVVLWMLFSHWVADFVCQSDWMAVNKSRDIEALMLHASVYTFVLGCLNIHLSFLFLVITFVAHFFTDGVTSRIASYLWEKEKRHWFFVTIGFDQLLHYAQLLITYKL